jgi:short-subunit dehydrogenase
MSERRTILITGATAGIGRHAALHLARRGHRVIATGRSAEALAALQREARGTDLSVMALDVDDPSSIARAVHAVDELTSGRGLDVLVNNAGYATAGPLAELDDAELRAQFDTNVFGLMAVTRAFLPAMFARGAGRVINVSSVSGRIPAPMLGAYHASKYALEALSDALRMELRPFGIHVAVVEPGTIRTGFAERTVNEAMRARSGRSRYAAVYDRVASFRETFARRAAGPEPVSRAIEHAATRRSPCTRYVAPARFAVLIVAFALLPTRWVDWLMCRIAGLTPEGLGLGRAAAVGQGQR